MIPSQTKRVATLPCGIYSEL